MSEYPEHRNAPQTPQQEQERKDSPQSDTNCLSEPDRQVLVLKATGSESIKQCVIDNRPHYVVEVVTMLFDHEEGPDEELLLDLKKALHKLDHYALPTYQIRDDEWGRGEVMKINMEIPPESISLIDACKNSSEPIILSWFFQICSAVYTIFKNDVLAPYIDMKEIVSYSRVDKGDRILVYVLSLAKQSMEDHGVTISIGATSGFAYASPEMIQSSSIINPEAQIIWGLGIILYTMLHKGQTPWENPKPANPMDIARRIIENKFDIDQGISPETQDLLRSLLSLTYTNRPRLAALAKRAEEEDDEKYDDPKIQYYNIEEIRSGLVRTIDPKRRERYLHDVDFEDIFGMSKSEFAELRLWRQRQLKRDADLF